jgi:hypothetical protein
MEPEQAVRYFRGNINPRCSPDGYGIVDEAVENGVGVGRIGDHRMPILDGKLAGDDGGAPAVTLFQNLQQVVSGLGVERLQPPVVQDQQIDPPQAAADAGVSVCPIAIQILTPVGTGIIAEPVALQ